ncbi:MAG: hypothetical protein JWL60_2360 [Gemmatimonadetes bacterium]|jgi:uncharacterized membrane protein|nr:hypothetical protein [Gemmatimonadota bacterium]
MTQDLGASDVSDVTDDLTAVDITDAHQGDSAERRKRRYVANLAFGAIKAQHSAHRTALQRAVDGLNKAASSPLFLVIHGVCFAFWLLWNTGALGLRPVDPYPFGLMTTIVSLEAIFLSIFVLMAQQREAAIAELREELGLQVSLRVEQEVTKTLQLVAGLYNRLGFRVGDDPELLHMLQPLDVKAIERDLLAQIEAATQAKQHNTMLDRDTPVSPIEAVATGRR